MIERYVPTRKATSLAVAGLLGVSALLGTSSCSSEIKSSTLKVGVECPQDTTADVTEISDNNNISIETMKVVCRNGSSRETQAPLSVELLAGLSEVVQDGGDTDIINISVESTSGGFAGGSGTVDFSAQIKDEEGAAILRFDQANRITSATVQ